MRVFLLTFLLVLCAGAGRCAPKQEFAYAVFSDGTVQGYSVGIDGHLTALPFAPMQVRPASADAGIGDGMDMTADPVRPVLYVSTYRLMLPHGKSGDLTGAVPDAHSTLRPFRIETDGRLTPLMPAPVPINAPLYSLTLAPKRRLLYALSADGVVYVFRVRPNGTLAPLPPAHVLGTFHPSIDPWNDLNHWGEVSAFFTFDPDERFGTLSFGANGKDVSFAETARYRVGTNGSLHCVQDISNPYGNVDSVNVTPDSRFLYLTGGGTQQFRITKRGRFAPLSPRTVGKDDGIAVLDPCGRFLYALSSETVTEGLCVYRVGKDGMLTFASRTALTGGFTEWQMLAPEPTGRFLYCAVPTGKSGEAKWGDMGFAVRPDGTLGTPFTLPVRNVPESFVFVRR